MSLVTGMGGFIVLLLIGCSTRDWGCVCETQLGTNAVSIVQNQPRKQAEQICQYIQNSGNYRTCLLESI